MTSPHSLAVSILAGLALSLATGCNEKTPLIRNSDKALRKPAAAFAADAKKRHPYPADAPRGDDLARAQVGYSLNRLEVVNLSNEAWADVEVWVNGTHVVFVPTMKPNELKVLNFQIFYDAKGKTFPVSNKSIRVNKVELFRDGKLSNVPLQLAD